MRKVFKNLGIGIGIFALIVLVGTCTFKQNESPPILQPDNSYISFLKEKQTELNFTYKKHFYTLQREKDSLIQLVSDKKKTLSIYRYKSNALEQQLREALAKVDSTTILPDSISPLAEIYFAIQQERDSACNQSIRAMEMLTRKQDSVIVIQNSEKDNFMELQKQQELNALRLTEQLNTAYKQQRKTILKSRLLSGTLILISGFTSALLINQTIK
jgi:hypothetical protein